MSQFNIFLLPVSLKADLLVVTIIMLCFCICMYDLVIVILNFLIRGLTPRLVMYMSQGAIFFTSYEFFKRMFSLEEPRHNTQTMQSKQSTEDDSSSTVPMLLASSSAPSASSSSSGLQSLHS